MTLNYYFKKTRVQHGYNCGILLYFLPITSKIDQQASMTGKTKVCDEVLFISHTHQKSGERQS